MKVMIEGNTKEIADFIAYLQSQHKKTILNGFIPEDSDGIKINGEKVSVSQ